MFKKSSRTFTPQREPLFPGRELSQIDEAKKSIARMGPIDDSYKGDGWQRIAMQGDLPGSHADRVKKLETAVKKRRLKTPKPLSRISKKNAEEDYRRFLGALQQAGIPWSVVAPELLISQENIKIAAQAFHHPTEPWRDVERLKALKFALSHMFSNVDLTFIAKMMAELRARHPAPKKSLPGERTKGQRRRRADAIKGEKLDDLRLLEVEFQKEALRGFYG